MIKEYWVHWERETHGSLQAEAVAKQAEEERRKKTRTQMGLSENWGGGGGVPYLGVLIIRVLLFRVLDEGSLFSATPK